MSAERLAAAFARLLETAQTAAPASAGQASEGLGELPLLVGSPEESEAAGAKAAVSPQMVFEALLFVGNPDSRPLSTDQAAAVLHGLGAEDFRQLAERLNLAYRAENRPYEVRSEGNGFRLVIRPQYERLRDLLLRRARRSRLSQAALDVLSLAAYHGPLSAEQFSELVGRPCGGTLRQLVRRGLLGVLRDEPSGRRLYGTTERFLEIFGLETLAELPRSQDFDPA